MIRGAVAVAETIEGRTGRAEQSRHARFPRFVALILDTIFVAILGGIVTAVYGVTEVTSGSFNLPNGISTYSTQSAVPGIWTVLVWLVYYTVCEAMFSATPGKAMNGLRVVSADDRPLTLGRIAVRNVLRLVDVLPGMYLIGGILVMTTENSRRLGDMAAHTTVVRREHAVQPGEARTAGRRAGLVLVAILVIALLFSAGFDYLGRPPLTIQGLYNTHQLLDPSITSYSLGTPTWSWGHVRYPLTASEPGKTCAGWIELDWYGIAGWQQSSAQLDCFPAS